LLKTVYSENIIIFRCTTYTTNISRKTETIKLPGIDIRINVDH